MQRSFLKDEILPLCMNFQHYKLVPIFQLRKRTIFTRLTNMHHYIIFLAALMLKLLFGKREKRLFEVLLTDYLNSLGTVLLINFDFSLD